MDCPICHMPLQSESLHGQTVQRCARRHGLWLSHAELGAIVRQTPPPSVAPKPVACSPGVVCPNCGETMAPFNFAHDSGVLINRCASCDAVWLESGQLELIAQYQVGSPAIQRLADALGDEIQASNRVQFARGLLRSRLLSGVVAIGYLLFVLWKTGSWQSLLSSMGFLLLPMACIWFPDPIGNLTGISLGLLNPMITRRTPGDMVAVGGWLLLLSSFAAALIAHA